MKVLWLTNIPSPYRIDFFNELGKYCDLTVLFEKRASSERDDSWKKFNTEHFKPIFLSGKSIGVAEAICLGVTRYLKKGEYDRIIITNFSDPTGMLAIAALRLKKIPYSIESDGGFAGTGKGMKEKVKKLLLSKADMYFSTAKEHDNYYMTYGAKAEQIIRYPFTSLHQKDILEKPVSVEEKMKIRKKLGMLEDHIVLAVGRFIHGKGYDILLHALTEINSDVGCYIVGGRAPQEYVDMVNSLNLTNVHFIDFKLKEELAEYYMAADVFVHPTRGDVWGLVINEAMAKGLPVVTTDKCIAGLEMICESQNGYIVKPEDVSATAQAIKSCIEKKNEMCAKSLQVARRYTIEAMSQRHMEEFERFNEKSL